MQDAVQTGIHSDEWARTWSLTKADTDFIRPKTRASRLDYAVKVAFYRQHGRFPTKAESLPATALGYLADQVDAPSSTWAKPKVRTGQRRKEKVLSHLGITAFGDQDRAELTTYLQSEPGFAAAPLSELFETVFLWCLARGVRPPPRREVERTHIALAERYASAEFRRIFDLIPSRVRTRMLASLAGQGGSASFTTFRREITGSGREAFYGYARKLDFIASLDLPDAHIGDLETAFIKAQTERMCRYEPREIRRFSDVRKVAMFAVYLYQSRANLTDKMIRVMLDAVHGVRERSKRDAAREAGSQREEAFETAKVLAHVLRASQLTPDRSVAAVVADIMSPDEVSGWLARQQQARSPSAATFEFMRSRWKNYYRPMLRVLLDTLRFKTNIDSQKPLLEALDWIWLNFDGRRPVHAGRDRVPVNGVLSDKERRAVVGRDGTVDRYHYELCVASRLRTALKGRAVWVEHSVENGDPDKDLPADFDDRPGHYYGELTLSQDADAFVGPIEAELEAQLRTLNDGLSANPSVNVAWTSDPRFLIKPFPPAKEPSGIARVKAELVGRWPKTSLLDMLKETALDTGFLSEFETIGERLNLDRATVNERLLLAIFGTGTNAGLKAMAGAVPGVTYNHLQHVQRRLMSADNLRRANARVSNAILSVRDPRWWGEQGTACASDSKQYPAWDNSLGTEYHARYGGHGIMVYWHVDGKSMCIYSRLKSVRSSEVASMVEGVLRHCTDMKVETMHTDSHGQTEVAFAFSHLLGFELAPRIKGVGRSKLYLSRQSLRADLGEIAPMLTRPIDWRLIASEYHEMVRYASALRNRDNSPETVLRKFTRSGVMHPTYKALQELGRAIKSTFVCRYLRSESLRREINEGLNVMENWNGATRFVLFGKSGEFTSRRDEDREMTVQALHLLQNSMVYVNTQMYQAVLGDADYKAQLRDEDLRALTPLLHAHVNPFGHYVLEMDRRIEGLRACL